jgi:hypothetical protein
VPDHEKSEASAVAEPRRSRAERGAKPNAPRAGRAMPRAAVNSEPQGGTATRVVKVRRGRREVTNDRFGLYSLRRPSRVPRSRPSLR